MRGDSALRHEASHWPGTPAGNWKEGDWRTNAQGSTVSLWNSLPHEITDGKSLALEGPRGLIQPGSLCSDALYGTLHATSMQQIINNNQKSSEPEFEDTSAFLEYCTSAGQGEASLLSFKKETQHCAAY
ncbi:unnamed protein product [Caretta caretta]